MKIVIVGAGYVGLVSGACLADLDNQVTCVDINKEKISQLQKGQVPFFESGLDDVVKRNIEGGRLLFSTSLKEVLPQAEIVFIAVGTPPKENGAADLSQVVQAAEEIGQDLDHYVVIVNKSTVPVGTAEKVKKIIAKHYSNDFAVVSNPEFLREGSAVEDFKKPDRIVVGYDSEKARKVMEKLYEDFACPKIFTTLESAEMIKYASNAFLATKISFINEIANICENIKADVEKVAEGMGLDKRIGTAFLKAGLGYGGSCFPKDIRALHQIAGRNGYPFQLLRAVIEVNNNQKWLFFQKVKDELKNLEDKTIAIWGLAFKPNTDDIRESIGIEITNRLAEEGARLKAFDPEAMENAKEVLAPGVQLCSNHEEAAKDADCLLIVTEWDIFKNPDFAKLKTLMKNPLIIDGRNIFDSAEPEKFGFRYLSMGRN